MTEYPDPPDTTPEMRRIGTSDPDPDSLTFTLDEDSDTVFVKGELKTTATLDTTRTNPGRTTKKSTLLGLLKDIHSDMVNHKRHCTVKIEFTLPGAKGQKTVTWICHAQADFV